MSAAPHTLLWKRVTSALHARGINPSGSQRELAGEARSKLGTDLVERFLNAYYFEHQYGGGASELSEEEAETLVHEIETLPAVVAAVPAIPAVPLGVVVDSAAPARAEAASRDWSALEEAEAYGAEGGRGSPLDGLRQFALELRVSREARQRERGLRKAAAAEARQVAANLRNKLRQAAPSAGTEEEAAARQHARQQADEQKQQRAVRTAAEAEAVLRRAGELQGQGNVRGAAAALEQLVRGDPDTAIGWFTLGWYFGRDGNFRRSTRCYQKGLKLDPKHKTAWNNLGHDLRGMRRHKRSAHALRQAIALDPDYITAWANLGTTLRERNKFAEAARAFEEVVRRRESDGTARYWLGDCRSRCGEHQGAVDAFLRASVIHPDNATLWMQLGDSLRKLGRQREAAEAYARARALGLPPPRLRSDLALWALLAIAASVGADRLASTALGLTAVGAFGAAVVRLRPDRVKLFWIAVAALPLLAMQFLDTPYAAPICMGLLILWTAIIAKIWRYRRRKSR